MASKTEQLGSLISHEAKRQRWRDFVEEAKLIATLKQKIENRLCKLLQLHKVQFPLIVPASMGLNDHLSGSQTDAPLSFRSGDDVYEVVQSNAKLKRHALTVRGATPSQGILTVMLGIRPGEKVDATHSNEVDQFDWEKVIDSQYRTKSILFDIARNVFVAIAGSYESKQSMIENLVYSSYPELEREFPEAAVLSKSTGNIKILEDAAARKHKAIFIAGIGKEYGRAPDYDDWLLNGDLIVWSDALGASLELSSMGIRVDSKSLKRQLDAVGIKEDRYSQYHRNILNDNLVLTAGGGIGISRCLMWLLEKDSIEEVRSRVF